MEIENLIIEVTRKCNLKCSHCLRGKAQGVNIDNKYITTLLKQVESINSITFTGGEPSLNVDAIKFFIKEVKRLKISVNGFYIVTNGKRITYEFIVTCLELYSICTEKEFCTLELSNDLYHYESMNSLVNDELLNSLTFYHKRNDNDFQRYELINEGRAKFNNMGKRDLVETEIETIEDFNDSNLYLNVFGQIVNGCDWSYSSQKNHVLCDVKNIKEYYKNLVE